MLKTLLKITLPLVVVGLAGMAAYAIVLSAPMRIHPRCSAWIEFRRMRKRADTR